MKIRPVEKQKRLSQSVAGQEARHDEDTGVSGPLWLSLDVLHPMENCIVYFSKKKTFTSFFYPVFNFSADIDIRNMKLDNLLKFTQII